MTTDEVRRDAVTRVLAYYMLAGKRVKALEKRVQNDRATRTEELILRRSKRFIEFVEGEFFSELISVGLNSLNCNFSTVDPWPAADFWAGVSLKCLAYLASTSSADQGEEAKQLLEQYQDDLRSVLRKINVNEVSGDYLSEMTEN